MIILMGVAGAGKSVQGRLLADEAGYPWLSTGELLRVLITGKRRQEMVEGKLLSDDEVINVVNKVLDLIDTSQEFVLDGFPRTVYQAEWILDQVKAGRLKMTGVFHLSASEDIVKNRLSERGRVDDNANAIEQRFQEYKAVTLPIIQHFEQENIPIYHVDASPPPLEVHKNIMNHLHRIEKESVA
jgi:adenylate kinase